MASGKIPAGRPRSSVDFATVSRLREEQNLGWSRMAEVYREMTGQCISRDAVKRRCLEAKVQKATAVNRTDL